MSTTVAVALLRGINVGGHKKLPMVELRRICRDAGCADVATYIQSGNVVLRTQVAPHELERVLERAIATAMGFDTPVVVRTTAELADLVAHAPYAEETDGTKRIVTFSRAPLPTDLLDGVDLAAAAPERATVRGRELIFHLPDGQARAVLPDLLGKALPKGSVVTTRNWRTVERLLQMAEELDAS